MHWFDSLVRVWPHLVAGLVFVAAVLASIHTLLNKRDSRAAVLWLGFIWLMPLAGPILYLGLGVNRIRRKALSLRSENPTSLRRGIPEDLGEPRGPEVAHLRTLAKVVDRVATRPLVGGNRVQALVNGDQLCIRHQIDCSPSISTPSATPLFSTMIPGAAGHLSRTLPRPWKFEPRNGAAVRSGIEWLIRWPVN